MTTRVVRGGRLGAANRFQLDGVARAADVAPRWRLAFRATARASLATQHVRQRYMSLSDTSNRSSSSWRAV